MGRDIQPIKITGEDRRTYRAKLARSLDVFARMLRDSLFEADSCLVGQEIELNLVDDNGAPSMQNADVLDAIADPSWATEVGQFNLEINVPPRSLDGDALGSLEEEIRASLNAGDQKARGIGSRLVMIGILPTLRKADVDAGAMSANERYKVLNEQIFAARGEDMRIEIDGAEQILTHADSITPEAACTSVQLHVQVSPGCFRELLERRPVHRRRAGGAGRQLPVPVRPAVVARNPDHAVRAGHRHPAGRAQAAGSAAQGMVRRALDHLGVRLVRREHPVFPGVAADLRGRGSAIGARQRRLPSACRDEPAQRDGLPLEPPGLRGRRRQTAPPRGEQGPASRALGRRHHGERRLLLRPGPRAGGIRAPGLDADVLRDGRREPARGRASWHGRAAVLARTGRSSGRGAGPAPVAADGARGTEAVGRGPGFTATACSASSSSGAWPPARVRHGRSRRCRQSPSAPPPIATRRCG